MCRVAARNARDSLNDTQVSSWLLVGWREAAEFLGPESKVTAAHTALPSDKPLIVMKFRGPQAHEGQTRKSLALSNGPVDVVATDAHHRHRRLVPPSQRETPSRRGRILLPPVGNRWASGRAPRLMSGCPRTGTFVRPLGLLKRNWTT